MACRVRWKNGTLYYQMVYVKYFLSNSGQLFFSLGCCFISFLTILPLENEVSPHSEICKVSCLRVDLEGV